MKARVQKPPEVHRVCPSIPAIALLLAASCNGVAGVPVGDAEVGIEGPAVLPLLDPERPVVEVTLDGREGLRFLLDTGSSLSLIDLPQAEGLGIPIGSGETSSTRGSGGGRVTYDRYATIDRLAAGGLEMERLRLPAIDIELLRDLELAGVLGQDLLARLVVLFDPPGRELHLLPPDTDEEELAAYLGRAVGGGSWVQAPVELRPCPYLLLDVDGLGVAAAELELDTGATTTSFPGEVVEALALRPTGTSSALGIDGSYEEPIYRLEDFGFYGFRVSGQIKRSRLDHGLLGMDVMGQFAFVLDGPRRTIWLHHREVEPADPAPGG